MDATTVGIWIGALGLVGTAVGVWVTSRSARDASRDAAEADRMLRMLLRALHNSELAEVKFDPEGRPIGLTIYGTLNAAFEPLGGGPVDKAVARDQASATLRRSDGSEAS